MCLGFQFNAHAQISPGDLTDYHAELEGMFKCTECHLLGQKIAEDKCLDCHKPLKARIDADKGYHRSSEVKGKDCISCHSEHHGRKFEIIRFDEDAFDHNLAGYKLEGAHAKEECAACHKTENITDPAILEKDYTYLGLEQACLTCHDDYHQNTLGEDCRKCHDFVKFEEAIKFEHNKTAFPLKGQHTEVACIDCHEKTQKNGKDFQAFANVAFESCVNCHDDVHSGRFGTKCAECHNEQSFQLINTNGGFNHNLTEFPLVGSHKRVNCKECHKSSTNSKTAFKEFAAYTAYDCVICHDDQHESRFGTDCLECHNQNSFRIKDDLINIDHNLTAYPLEGAHETVDCRKCHVADLADPLAFGQCISCHTDYHDGQFPAEDGIRDCKECHNNKKFAGSTFSFEEHAKSAFPLEGAHLATPCMACHLKDEHWEFKEIGNNCVDCHEDIHEDYLDSSFYPDQRCTNCHSENSWTAIAFDHEQTDFPLEGRHQTITCGKCHLKEVDDKKTPVQFTSLEKTCESCHNDVHFGQFALDELTRCDRCHSPENWEAPYFKHDSTAFALDGAHESLDCGACHKPVDDTENHYIVYKIESFECIDCHQ
jgi:hypothetical protein